VFLEAPETKMHVNLMVILILASGENLRGRFYNPCAFPPTGTSLEFVCFDDHKGGSNHFPSLFSVVCPSSTGDEIIRVLAAEMHEWAVRG
jgi:hypothetical protein